MKTKQKFTANVKGCGRNVSVLAKSSIQNPTSANGITHLHFRNITELHSPHNFATFKSGGLAGFFFHLVDDGCYRVVFKVKKHHEVPDHPITFFTHIHEMGEVEYQQSNDNGYTLLSVELGNLSASPGYWAIYVTMHEPHPDSVFSFYEASLTKLT